MLFIHSAWLRAMFPNDWHTRKPETWIDASLPVAQEDGVYLVSCAIMDRAVFQREAFSQAARDDISGPQRTSDRYRFRRAMYGFDTVSAPEFTLLIGAYHSQLRQLQEILTLLGTLSLGVRRKAGWGEIRSITLLDWDTGLSPVLTKDGAVLRPLPAGRFREPPPRSILRDTRLRPPYWQGPTALCYCPTPTTLYGLEASR